MLEPAVVADGDYTSPAQVEIDAGETSATIEVNTVDDDAAENTETFTLTLDAAPAGLSLGTAEATGRITDNDPINVTVEGPDLVVRGKYRQRVPVQAERRHHCEHGNHDLILDDQWHGRW